MSLKGGIGIGVPFGETGGAAAPPPLADGYYFQNDLADPQTNAGWTATTKFHDGSAGDTTTDERNAGGGAESYLSFLVANATGMTFDRIVFMAGYAGELDINNLYGSNDLATWDPLVFSTVSFPATHVSYGPGAATHQLTSGSLGPYAYVVGTIKDTASDAQAGLYDIRIRLGSTDVGPA